MFALKKKNEKILENYVKWLLLAFKKLCGDLQVIANSGEVFVKLWKFCLTLNRISVTDYRLILL